MKAFQRSPRTACMLACQRDHARPASFQCSRFGASAVQFAGRSGCVRMRRLSIGIWQPSPRHASRGRSRKRKEGAAHRHGPQIKLGELCRTPRNGKEGCACRQHVPMLRCVEPPFTSTFCIVSPLSDWLPTRMPISRRHAGRCHFGGRDCSSACCVSCTVSKRNKSET